MASADFIANHHHKIDQAPANAAQGAFLPVRERDIYSLGPQPTVMRELDSTYQGLIFPDFSLEEPELESIMEGIVPQEIKTRILAAVRRSYAYNQEIVQLLDS